MHVHIAGQMDIAFLIYSQGNIIMAVPIQNRAGPIAFAIEYRELKKLKISFIQFPLSYYHVPI